MAKIDFPKDFMWGGASAAEQAEGHGNTGKGKTNWDKYFELHPDHFFNGVGPSITSDFFNKYKEDIQLYKAFNVNSVRIGISWARLFPDGETISEKGLAFYRDLIEELKKNDIRIVLTLFHFDMPLWAQEMGAWSNRSVTDKFIIFAEAVYKEFANDVEFIATFNEPNVPVMGGYLMEFHWPLKVDSKEAFEQGYGIILAHARAVNLYKEKYNDCLAQIGAVINVNPAIPKDGVNFTEEDAQAAKSFDALHNLSVLFPMVKGEFHPDVIALAKKYDLLPTYTQDEIDEIKKVKIDFLGTNFYSPARVQAPQSKNPKHIFEQELSHFHWDEARYNVWRGWEIRPESLYDLSMFIKNELGNIPFFISENGMGVQDESKYRDKSTGEINDDYRIAFIQEHLEQLNRAMQEGANCFGYHMWAICDNWSWRNAYKNRYGFIEIDIETQERRLKKSAHWFGEMIANNGFSNEYKKVDEVIDLKNAEYEKSV